MLILYLIFWINEQITFKMPFMSRKMKAFLKDDEGYEIMMSWMFLGGAQWPKKIH